MAAEADRSGTAAPRRARGPRSPRRIGAGFPVLAVLACVAGLAFPRVQRELRAVEAASPSPWIDPALAELAGAPAWADPRWLEHLAQVLAGQEPFETAAPVPAELPRAVEALSFVERVVRCEVAGGRLALALVLRKPVACIPVRGEFALVDEDGVVLEGRWPVPPRLGKAYLPVIGPADDPLFDRARSGDWLVEPEHLDAIDVALSLAEHLDEARRAALGRIVIDARAGRRASVEEPGVRLELEGGRVALFGRAPGSGAPGELDARAKWLALARALELFARDPLAHDWELVDLRWDRPDLALRRPSAPEPAVAVHAPVRTQERAPVRAAAAQEGQRERDGGGRRRVR